MKSEQRQVLSEIRFSFQDGTNVEFRHMFSISDIQFFGQISQKATLARVKKILFWNNPILGPMMQKVVNSLLSEKLCNRFVFANVLDDFKDHIKPISILPEYLGGSESMDNLIKFSKDSLTCGRGRSVFKHYENVEIEWRNVPKKGWFNLF